MQLCNHCLTIIEKFNSASKIDLTRSLTKIGGTLHLGLDRPEICPVLSSYVPDTIILAGNGAIEVSGGGDCWEILKDKMEKEGLLGEGRYQKSEDALTWLAAQQDFFSHTSNPSEGLKFVTDIKVKIIQPLQSLVTRPRQLYCHSCSKHHDVPLSEKILVLTTNWDLGLFKLFPNIIQLHGRCDHPEQAVLPLQNISSLMPKDFQDIVRLNCGILPSVFLKRCLEETKNFIFWGTGLNDYDAALWHFLRGFLITNPLVKKVGIATRNNPENVEKARNKVARFFPPLRPSECFCSMLSSIPTPGNTFSPQ
jgi:hypothetical protein